MLANRLSHVLLRALFQVNCVLEPEVSYFQNWRQLRIWEYKHSHFPFYHTKSNSYLIFAL